jgi:hypothetical protein
MQTHREDKIHAHGDFQLATQHAESCARLATTLLLRWDKFVDKQTAWTYAIGCVKQLTTALSEHCAQIEMPRGTGSQERAFIRGGAMVWYAACRLDLTHFVKCVNVASGSRSSTVLHS